MKIYRVFPDPEFIQTSITAATELRKELARINGTGFLGRERQFYTELVNEWIDIADSCFRKASIRNSAENYRTLRRLEKTIINTRNNDQYNITTAFVSIVDKLETVIIDSYSLMEKRLSPRNEQLIKTREKAIASLKAKIAEHRAAIKNIKRRT